MQFDATDIGVFQFTDIGVFQLDDRWTRQISG